jgi:hypothetical protein
MSKRYGWTAYKYTCSLPEEEDDYEGGSTDEGGEEAPEVKAKTTCDSKSFWAKTKDGNAKLVEDEPRCEAVSVWVRCLQQDGAVDGPKYTAWFVLLSFTVYFFLLAFVDARTMKKSPAGRYPRVLGLQEQTFKRGLLLFITMYSLYGAGVLLAECFAPGRCVQQIITECENLESPCCNSNVRSDLGRHAFYSRQAVGNGLAAGILLLLRLAVPPLLTITQKRYVPGSLGNEVFEFVTGKKIDPLNFASTSFTNDDKMILFMVHFPVGIALLLVLLEMSYSAGAAECGLPSIWTTRKQIEFFMTVVILQFWELSLSILTISLFFAEVLYHALFKCRWVPPPPPSIPPPPLLDPSHPPSSAPSSGRSSAVVGGSSAVKRRIYTCSTGLQKRRVLPCCTVVIGGFGSALQDYGWLCSIHGNFALAPPPLPFPCSPLLPSLFPARPPPLSLLIALHRPSGM